VTCFAVAGCSEENPVGPDTYLNGLYIAGVCIVFPDGAPPGLAGEAVVAVREGSDAGQVVSGLDVSISGAALSFDQSLSAYTGMVGSLEPGEDAALCVDDGNTAIVRIVTVPWAPDNVHVGNDHWNISGPNVVNSVTWRRPGVSGDWLVVAVYDYDESTGAATELYWTSSGDVSSTAWDIRNSQLAYYATMSSATCVVGHANSVALEYNPEGSSFSVVAAAGGNWPCWGRACSEGSGMRP
jgi:hypothetical protein